MRTLRPHAPALLAAALVTLASWPVAGPMWPGSTSTASWEIALRQAVHDGLDFGPDVLFTYGPLGFLREPLLVHPWSARLAFAWGVLVQFALVRDADLGAAPRAALAARSPPSSPCCSRRRSGRSRRS